MIWYLIKTSGSIGNVLACVCKPWLHKNHVPNPMYLFVKKCRSQNFKLHPNMPFFAHAVDPNKPLDKSVVFFIFFFCTSLWLHKPLQNVAQVPPVINITKVNINTISFNNIDRAGFIGIMRSFLKKRRYYAQQQQSLATWILMLDWNCISHFVEQ